MIQFLLRRLLLTIPVLLGLTALVFVIARLLPGDPVALAAGLVATRLDGSPLKYNVPELLLPDLVVCHPDRADEVRLLLDAAGFGLDGASGAGAAESAG